MVERFENVQIIDFGGTIEHKPSYASTQIARKPRPIRFDSRPPVRCRGAAPLPLPDGDGLH